MTLTLWTATWQQFADLLALPLLRQKTRARLDPGRLGAHDLADLNLNPELRARLEAGLQQRRWEIGAGLRGM